MQITSSFTFGRDNPFNGSAVSSRRDYAVISSSSGSNIISSVVTSHVGGPIQNSSDLKTSTSKGNSPSLIDISTKQYTIAMYH